MSNYGTNYRKVADIFAALGNPVRVRILLAIGSGESCVCHLEANLGLRQAYLSQHLMALRQAGIIQARKDGRFVYYRLVQPNSMEFIRLAGKLAGVELPGRVSRKNCECPNCAETAHEKKICTCLSMSARSSNS